jgi:hypothetical protein
MVEQASYVYGVVDDARLPPLPEGIDGRPVRLVAGDGLFALVSSVSRLPVRASRRNLEAHTAVLRAMLAEANVLPMRFGGAMPSDAAVAAELLAGERETLAQLLLRLEGKLEFELKVVFEEATLLAEVVAARADIRRLRERVRQIPASAAYYERLQLGELVHASLERKRAEEGYRLLATLAPHAADLRVAEELPESVLLKAAFLVERARVERFERAVDDIVRAEAPRLQFRLYGPLPPFSFSDVPLAAGAST